MWIVKDIKEKVFSPSQGGKKLLASSILKWYLSLDRESQVRIIGKEMEEMHPDSFDRKVFYSRTKSFLPHLGTHKFTFFSLRGKYYRKHFTGGTNRRGQTVLRRKWNLKIFHFLWNIWIWIWSVTDKMVVGKFFRSKIPPLFFDIMFLWYWKRSRRKPNQF